MRVALCSSYFHFVFLIVTVISISGTNADFVTEPQHFQSFGMQHLSVCTGEVTGTRPFKGVSSICILVTQIYILSELGPWSAMVGDGPRIRA